MSEQPCYLCGSHDHERVQGKVRNMPALGILRCRTCGLVFLEDRSHITDDYYTEKHTETTHGDEQWTDLLQRGNADEQRWADFIRPIAAKKALLDVGCGAGGVLLRAREFCDDVSGVEPQTRWRQALVKAGVRVFDSLDKAPDGAFDVVTLFHVVEHLKDPIATLQLAGRKLKPNGRLIVEVPNADDALLTLYNSKAYSEFGYWSAHLFLFNAETLARLLARAGLQPLTMSHVQRYPLSNHLHWLALGRPGGHETWQFLDSPELTDAYARQLASLGKSDTLLASAAIAA